MNERAYHFRPPVQSTKLEELQNYQLDNPIHVRQARATRAVCGKSDNREDLSTPDKIGNATN